MKDPAPPNLSALLDLPLTLRLVIGSSSQTAQTVLKMGPGSIVSLDTESGGQLALFSGNKLLGRAEIVIVEGKPALRITHIESDPQRN